VKLALMLRLRSAIFIVGAAVCVAAGGFLAWQAPTALAKPHRATAVATLHRQLEAVEGTTRNTTVRTVSTRALLLAEQRTDAHLAAVLRSQTAQIAALKKKVRALQD
jgi:hypothetical protein